MTTSITRVKADARHRHVRLRVELHAPGLLTIHEEQVAGDALDTSLTPLQVRTVEVHSTVDIVWLRDVLTELLGEIADTPALHAEIERLRSAKTPINVFTQLENVIGPHCSHCGAEIDPDYCHCGERIDAHDRYNDPHAPVPMGCICGYSEPDLKTLAKSRGELLAAQRRALTHLFDLVSNR